MQGENLVATTSLEETTGEIGIIDKVTGLLSIEPMDAVLFMGKIIGAGLILWVGLGLKW